jgi:membrane dipeptidase
MLKAEISKNEIDRAENLHDKSIFINSQDSSSLNVIDDVVTSDPPTNLTLYEEFMKGGVTCGLRTIFFDEYVKDYYTTLWVPSGEEVFRKVSDHLRYVNEHPQKVLVATTAESIERAKREGKMALILEFQWPEPVANSSVPALSLVHGWYAMGIRAIQLAYNKNSLLADGCGEPRNAGLSRQGEATIEEMNKVGMLIDLTHVGDQSCKEAMEMAKKGTCSLTHANARALCASKINKPDDLIKMCAEKGGVTGICGLSPRLRLDRLATIEDFMVQIDYVVKLVGIDYVGIGLDYPMHYKPQIEPFISAQKWELWKRVWPEYIGYARAKDVPATAVPYKSKAARMADGLHAPVLWRDITKHLVHRGYSDQDIQKILGLNFLRQYRGVFGS